MKQLVESLLENGFHEVNNKGEKVAKDKTSTEWQHVQAVDPTDVEVSKGKTEKRRISTFVKGQRKVQFEHQPSGATSFKNIRFTDGDQELLFTNTGDMPSPEFLASFYGVDVEEVAKPVEETPAPAGKKK
jgi:hypothetical protein